MNITHIFPGAVWGGAEQYVLDLGRALSARGHNVTYLCRDAAAVTSRLHGEIPYTLLSSASLRRAVAQSDVVHIHDARFLAPVMRAKKKTGSAAKVVLTRHIARPSRTWPLRRRHYRALHCMIFVSQLAHSLWSGANEWMPAHLLRVVHNSIADHPEGAAAAVDLRDEAGIPADVPLIMFTGRIRKSKGVTVLIEALAQLRNLPWHLVLVGTCKPSKYREEIMRLAAHHGIEERITFTGFTADVYPLIAQCDVGVAPSIVREACPLSPMEFMRMGKMVITTDNGAQPEYVKGLMVPPADEQPLADALYRAITDAPLRERLGCEAREYFDRQMSYAAFVDKILACYV